VKLGEALRRAVPANARLHAMEERPIAFGLRALIAVVILGDTSGGTEEAEVAFARVPGVESVEVEEVGLL
jgi:elongation factor 1-beta